ncbi:MAG: hypothetical protein QOI20_548, partial [Acidimicrobiaceae bacterium]|nr:hypothetical protein [Acidimicrobiaceae bacterium]
RGFKPPPPPAGASLLALYRALATPADEGARMVAPS